MVWGSGKGIPMPAKFRTELDYMPRSAEDAEFTNVGYTLQELDDDDVWKDVGTFENEQTAFRVLQMRVQRSLSVYDETGDFIENIELPPRPFPEVFPAGRITIEGTVATTVDNVVANTIEGVVCVKEEDD